MAEERRNAEVSGTVTVVLPLWVVVDGATVASTADRHSEVTALAVGDRVTVQDRAPRRPLVVGKIEKEAEAL